tara:strand:+ start:283 stop:1674 length:1392 start_codon:yes stop_codon:yes gene_type:complete
MAEEMRFYLPIVGKTDVRLKNIDDYNVKKLVLDYIFIYYEKDRMGLENLDELLEEQDEEFEKRNKEYTQENINTLYNSFSEALESVKDMDLRKLILEDYAEYRIKLPKDIINWVKTFDGDVEDVETMPISDLYSEEKTAPLTGVRTARQRQKMDELSRGIPDDIILQRIQEGQLSKIKTDGGKIGYEIQVPSFPPESPLSNQQLLRESGVNFRIEQTQQKTERGTPKKYSWPLPSNELKRILKETKEDKELFYLDLAISLKENFPVNLLSMDDKYRKIEQVNEINIYMEFDEKKLDKVFEGVKETPKLLEDLKDMIVPVIIEIDYVTTAILDLELGGKRLKGKERILEIKDKIEDLKENLDDAKIEEEDKQKIQEKITTLEENLEEAEREKESEKESEEARTQSEGTEEEEAVEGFEEEPKKVTATGQKVIPQLDKYFRKLKSRINRLDRVIGAIKSQDTIEV